MFVMSRLRTKRLKSVALEERGAVVRAAVVRTTRDGANSWEDLARAV
jgi:hypothetical protein